MPANLPTVLFGVTSGTSLQLLGSLPRKLLERGCQVHIVANSIDPEFARVNPRISIHEIPMSREPSVVRDILALARWFFLIRAIRPDIVSIGTPKAALLGLVVAFLTRIPIRLYTLRGLRLETETGVKRRFLQLLERVTSSCATHVIAVSHSLRKLYVSEGFAEADKVTVFGRGSSHGVDLERFLPRNTVSRPHPAAKIMYLAESQSPVIGFIGRLTADKGMSALVRVRELLEEFNVDHEMLVVGRDEDGDYWEQQLSSSGKPPVFVGEVTDTSLFYQVLDILLLPTKREGFPNVVLEASASGVAVITTTATGAIDSVIHGKTGILVETADDEKFASATLSLLKDPSKMRQLGAAGRAWVEKEFSQESLTQIQARFYLKLYFSGDR